MNNAVVVLADEKQRLENWVAYSSEKFREACAPALVQRPSKNPQGEDVMISYIDVDRFTAEQREQFDKYSKFYEEKKARLCVFENYVKGLVPQETVQSFNQYVEPLESFKGVSIPSNIIELDEKGALSKFSIKVGPVNVESPREMTIEEFSQLYTSALGSVLTGSLEAGLSQEEAMQQLQSACAEVYLQQQQDNKISL